MGAGRRNQLYNEHHGVTMNIPTPEKGKIIYVPLEHVDGRYTVHMDRDIELFLNSNNIEYIKVMPDEHVSPPPPTGQFLNSAFTSKFKSTQMAMIAELYQQGKITDDDRFFFSDIWMPGIESIAYMNYFHKINPKITGVIHAGSFTDTDFVRDMERWANKFEDIIFDIADTVFCASEFIRADIIKKRVIDPRKLVVSGLPVDLTGLGPYLGAKKENIVIFNGRLCDEKQPWLFDQLEQGVNKFLRADAPRIKFIKTQEENLSKEEYYALLAKSKVIVSYALQENFGFGVAEAVYLGCQPVLPNRLVYPELYPKEFLFDNFEESIKMTATHALEDKVQPFLHIDNPVEALRTWFVPNYRITK